MAWFILRLLALKTTVSSCIDRLARTRLRVGVIFGFSLSSFLLGVPMYAQALGPNLPSVLNVDSMLQFFADMAFSGASGVVQMIVLLIDAMVPIMTYNNFVGNPVVKAGWAIVRDTVNMFFVIVLIIIAFGTIFGHAKFKWQQQVPRLLIFAIVINFSKTLAGIMIDFGQVIMITFANALREIAAGNFIQLLGLNQIYSVSQSSASVKAALGQAAGNSNRHYDYFAAGVASFVLTLWVFATLVILVAILLFRIIMLWVLVVLAPLAWFMGGVAGEGGFISSKAYADWWNEFKCMVMVGPVLLFFLWLTLAVAGAGNIAANSGFVVSANSNNAGFETSLLELNNFLSFLIGIAMLMSGFKAATQVCNSVQGKFIGKALGAAEGMPSLAKRAVLTSGGLAARGGSLGLRAGAKGMVAGAAGAGALARNVLPAGLVNAPGNIGRAIKGGAAGAGAWLGGDTAAGQYFKGKQMDTLQAGRAARFESVDKAKETLKGKDANWKKSRIESMLKNPPSSEAGKAQMIALFEEMMGDKRMQKGLGAETVKKMWDTQGADYGKMAGSNPEKIGALADFKKSNAHMTGSAHLISNYADVQSLSDEALKDKDVQERLKKVRSTKKNKDGTGYLNAYEALEQGHDGAKRADLLKNDRGQWLENMTGVELQNQKVEEIGKNGSGEVLQRSIDQALSAGDVGRANDLISQMGERYSTEKDPKKQADMLLAMDATSAMLAGSKTSGSGTALAHLQNTRAAKEREIPPPVAGLGEGEDGGAFAEGMKNASATRKESAVNQLESQKSASAAALATAEGQKESVMAGRTSAIESELEALSESLAQARVTIDKELQDKTASLSTQLSAANSQLAAVSSNPSAPQAWKDDAKKTVDDLKAQHDQAKAQSTWPKDRAKAVEGDPRVQKIKVEIGTTATKLPGDMAEVKELNTKITSLTKHLQELEIAKAKLK